MKMIREISPRKKVELGLFRLAEKALVRSHCVLPVLKGVYKKKRD